VRRLALQLVLSAAIAAVLAAPAGAAVARAGVPATAPQGARIVSVKGRFVPMPEFPGVRIDERLLRDVRWMVRHFHVRVTDAYSLSPVHQATGEHPRGLAVDLEPGEGGTWADVARLARFAEPRQDQPRPPFKWVGWNGDAGHGDPAHCKVRRGCWPHLHISWQHGDTPRAHPAPWVATLSLARTAS
jgi:hypothetical protein